MKPSDLVRLAELIRLGARAAQMFAEGAANDNGQPSRVADLCRRIEGLANELLGIAHEIEAAASDDC